MYRVLSLMIAFLVWLPEPLVARRLRVATVKTDPFYMQKQDGGYEGFLVDLMEDLIDRATGDDNGDELQYRFQLVPDGRFGNIDSNGRWNGLMGQVVNGEADMGVAALTVTKSRMEAVYFSHPFMSTVILPLIKKPSPGAHVPFANLTDLYAKLQSRELSLGYIEHGSTELFLSQHKLPLVRAIYNISKAANTESPFVNDNDAGVSRIRTSAGRFVFYGEHVTMQRFAQTAPCDTALAWEGNIGVRYFAFIFPKTESGHQLLQQFNQFLLAAEEDGTIAALTYRWWDQKATCPESEMCLCNNNHQHST